MAKVIASIIFFAGVSLLAGLWVLPTEQAAQFRKLAAAELAASVTSDNPASLKESRRQYFQSVIDDPNLETEFRFEWAVTLALGVCCVAAGILMFLKSRFWAIAVVISAAFYASRTEFVWPLYEIFFKGISSFDQLLSRVAIFGQSPEMLATIAWFNLAVPGALMVAVAMAIWPTLAQLFRREGSENNAL